MSGGLRLADSVLEGELLYMVDVTRVLFCFRYRQYLSHTFRFSCKFILTVYINCLGPAT